MDSILVGTASWTDPTLIESGWYPEDAKGAEGRLKYYASQFPVVEVDSAFYALPTAHNATLWAERTPEGFVFDIKAYRLFTGHPTPLSALPPDIRQALGAVPKERAYGADVPRELTEELWQRFTLALRPLDAAGKLGTVLLQFPPWYVYRPSNLEHILHCVAELAPYAAAVEFRHRSWFDDKHRDTVLAFLREQGLVHVVVDEPQAGAASIPQVWEVTSPAAAILRLHGRNVEAWQAKGMRSAADRFDYYYSQAELRELVGPVRALAQRARRVHVLFNNCHGDDGVRNAFEFRELLG
ncbi:DUF72 domain-containing protein [Azoarcus sp. KH32C]|uniref:DUF72 domain-containing protein n=1 Tax=Azoarcus sp. KH32C TaxID=748247 RepID=UPI0002385F47|nr:DUF72 domain-containing protein [Azoarcus sp. KH32C]BAL26695.1 hypothetical protein AZKH_4418 [Azoarcus sp. KH32C]